MTDGVPSLYEWAGGMAAFEHLFQMFYDKVLADELLQPVFAHMSPEHRMHVAHFVAEVFGGPAIYTIEDDGSHAKMIRRHIGRLLSEAQRQRWMCLLLQTADEVELKTDPEFRSALVGYIEWGSRIAVSNSHLTENPVGPEEPMPHWGWGETGGPYQP